MKTKHNILVIQTAFIGDITLSVFFANEIKQMLPNSRLSFVSTPVGCEVLKCFTFIDEVISFDKRKAHKGLSGIKEIAKNINGKNKINEKYDYVFALHRSYRTAILLHLIYSKNKIGFNTNAFSCLLSKKIEYKKHLHEVERNRNCLSIFNEFSSNFDYLSSANTIRDSFTISQDDIKTTNGLIPNEEKYILVAPGSVWATKRWLPEYFAELCCLIKQLDIPVFLIGSFNEASVCDYISERNGAVSLAGKTTIPQSLELIKKSLLVITNDSAPTHFASLFNIPTVTIFGPTIPAFGFAPLAKKSVIIEDTELFCRPCSPHGEKECFRKTFNCMKNIKSDIVLDAVKKIIGL